MRDVADPELIGAARAEAMGQVRKDRTLVVTVRGAYELAQWLHLQAVLPHESRDRPVIHRYALNPQLSVTRR
jgi:hypothetical protein